MKKITFLIALVISSVLFSQIKIDNSKNPETVGSILAGSITLMKLDDTRSFCYSDIKFTKIKVSKCFSFKETGNDLDNLYGIMKEGLANPPKENIKLDFPDDKIELFFTKTMGVPSVQFYHIDKDTGVTGVTAYITKRNIDKLFGKN